MQLFNYNSDHTLWLYVLVWISIIGLCLGSFFNVVILRSLSNESIVFPASKCPKCGNKLKYWHNIPVLSYILLRGKCFFCKEPISIQYPLVELTTMILFAISYIKFGVSVSTLFILFWISCLIIMTGTDIKEQVVDCNIAIVMGISGILYNFIFLGKEFGLYSILGLIIGIIILEIIARSGYLLTKTRAMGEADTYVAGALGAIFGKQILLVLLLGLIASMFFIIPVFFYNQFKQNNKLTCILGIIFTLTILAHLTLWQNYFTFSILLIAGIGLCICTLKNIKNEENRHYLPYVPALTLGTLYFLFFIL